MSGFKFGDLFVRKIQAGKRKEEYPQEQEEQISKVSCSLLLKDGQEDYSGRDKEKKRIIK